MNDVSCGGPTDGWADRRVTMNSKNASSHHRICLFCLHVTFFYDLPIERRLMRLPVDELE